MLRRKLAMLILVTTMTNMASTPLTAFAETLRAENVIEESQQVEKDEDEVREAKISRFEPYYSQRKDAYNELFKMDNSNIEKVETNGGYLNYYSTIENMTDGNMDTYWETAKQNSSTFNNEVIFTLKDTKVLNRIAYKAAFNTVGFAENFEIWSAASEEAEFKLVATGSTTKTTDVVEFKFEPTEFKKIKFVYKSAYQNKATATEFMFYSEDGALDKVNRLFTDNTMAVVSEEFRTIDAINVLEEEFKLHPFYEDYKENFENARALLSQEQIEAGQASVSKFEPYYSDKKQGYDDAFKMDNSNIHSITSNGGRLNGYVGTEKIIDGKLDTYWETGRHTSTSFNNELIFTLKESTTLNRIVYRSAWNTVGFAENFEVWASSTTKGDTFRLVSSATATKTADVVEIKFNPTSFKRIKFVFKNSGTATASEMMFYEEDAALDKVKALFTDNSMSTVSEAFNTVDKINSLEEEFKSHPFYEDYKENFENARILLSEGKIEATKAKVSKFETYYSEYRDQYDATYKMDNSNVQSIISTGGNRDGSVVTGKIIDGSLDTYWETGKHTTESFKNELIVTLEEATVLNRIAYRSAWNTVGFAEDFEIWASNTTKGDTFQLVSSAKASKTADVVEIKFNPTSFKRIKFVFKNTGTATASEMMFYKEDKVKDKVERLFTSSGMDTVSEEFNSIEKITALEEEAKSHPLYELFANDIQDAKDIVSGQLQNIKTVVAEQHGDRVAHANQNLKIGFGNNNQPTGVAALPGETITVYVDVEPGKPVPKLMFSQQEGSWSSWGRTVQLKAGKNEITVPRVTFDNNYKLDVTPGGPVYIVNPYTEEQQGKAPVIRFAKGVQAFPMFDKNTNEEEFIEFLKEYKEKLDEDAKNNSNVRDRKVIDTFELVADHVVITGTTSGAYEAYINRNFKPSQSLKLYNDHMDMLFKYQGIDGSNEKNDIKYSRENIRLAQPWAAMYAAGDHIGIQRDLMVSVLTNVGGWGIDHEIGHKMDIGVRTIGEVTNNMLPQFSSYYYNSPNRRIKFETMYNSLIGTDNSKYEDFGVFEKLGVFWQLEMVYPGYWAELNKAYRENDIKVKDMNDKLDKLAYYSSKVLELDLTEHFERHGFPVTDATKEFASNYEKPDKKIWYANYNYKEYEGEGFTSNPNLEVSTSKQGDNIKVSFNLDEEFQNDVIGYEVYRDGELVAFTPTNSFVDTEVSYTDKVTYKVVPFDKKLNEGEAVEVSSFKPALKVQQNEITLKLREEFNPMDIVESYNYKGESIKESVQVKSNLDVNKKGSYEITYSVTDENIITEEVVKVNVVSDYDYLSDYEWESVETDYPTAAPRRNTNIKGRVNGKIKTFEKGFGIHANGKIVYDLSDKDYDTFEALLGVDMNISAQDNSSISFEIIADGETLATTKVLKHADDMVYVNVPINGVEKLIVEIHDGGNSISSDHAVIANPKLTSNNVKPVITAENKEYKLGETVDFTKDVTAYDAEDGDLSSRVEVVSNSYEEGKLGRFEVVYGVTDSDSNYIEKKAYVTVYEDFNVIKSKYGQFNNLNGYNEQFKIPVVSISNNAGNWGTSVIGNAIDGNLNTHWETNKQNTTSFKNEVIFDLGETKEISRISYAARRNESYKGFAKKFEIYVSTEAEGDDFVLAGKGEYKGNIGDVVEFKINKTNARRVKFKFIDVERDWASLSEISFYKEDVLAEKIESLFTDSSKTEVREAYNTLAKVDVLDKAVKDHPAYSLFEEELNRAREIIIAKLPKIELEETTYVKLNSDFDPMAGVSATDQEDGVITDRLVVNGEGFNINKTGEYTITYTVEDNNSNITTKERIVVVYSDSKYLSDINWVTATTQYNSVRKDRSSGNQTIKLLVDGAVKEFEKGIGTHANSEIVYNLEGTNYEYFETYVGIDRNLSEQDRSSVIFKVLADGVEVYNSGVMKYGTEAKLVRVPVKGVKKLQLIANDAGNTNSHDHANFADAKFLITNSKPELNIPQSISTTLGYPIDINEEYSAMDAEDGDLTDRVKVSGEVNFDKTGEYTLTYTVVDNDGNEVTKTRTVAVVDMNDFTYLTEYDWKSETHDYSAPKRDVGTSSNPIRLTDEDGREVRYDRGLGMHSNSTVTYDLSDKNYDYFTAYVGVDRSSYNTIGSVTFEVHVDGVKKFDSGLMRSTDPKQFVKVDINGAKELKLVVTDAKNGKGNDHASWGDTKLHYAKENGASIDRTELDGLIKIINELNSKVYTEETFNNLKAVLEDVNTELADGYSQEEIDTLYKELKEAYDGLVKLTNFTALEEAIAEHSNYNELHYFREHMEAHKAVIEEAKGVLANKDATQEEIDEATAKVNESAKTLVLRENKVDLEKKLKEAKAIENKNYIELRWSNFVFAIEYAEGIYNNVDSTDEEIRSGLFTLEYFKGELK